MKIEMAEKMMESYLKNVERCPVVELNWMPNRVQVSVSMTPGITARVDGFMQTIKNAFPNYNLFKKNTTQQFINQAEVDILGVRRDDSTGKNHVYLVDTAFHENGLGYKDVISTVLKKLVRAAILGDLLFPNYVVHVWFVTPSINPKPRNAILSDLKVLIPLTQQYNSDIDIACYLGVDCKPLVDDLINLSGTVSDDNDLFMRTVKLLDALGFLANSAGTTMSAGEITSLSPAASANVIAMSGTKHNNKAHVLNVLNDLNQKGKLKQTVLCQVTNLPYSQQTFGISSYPLLKLVSKVTSDEKDRYYSNQLIINGEAYSVVNQWKPENLKKLDNWASTL